MKSLIPILLAIPLLGGCDAMADMVEPALTPEQDARLEVLESENNALGDELTIVREEALDAIKEADAERGKAALATLEKLLGEQEAITAEAKTILDSNPSKMTGFMKLVGSIPGPWQPLIPLLGTALTVLAGRRSRKWAWISMKNVLSVGLLDTLKNLGRTVGSIHSSDSSEAAAVADPTSPLTS